MFATYADRQQVYEVATKYRISHRTVERYRRLERWDDRVAEIRAKALLEADYSIAQAMADSLKMVRLYKQKLADVVERKMLATDDATVADLERIIRLEAFVLGASESRHELVTAFSEWSDSQLEHYARTGERPSQSSRSTA